MMVCRTKVAIMAALSKGFVNPFSPPGANGLTLKNVEARIGLAAVVRAWVMCAVRGSDLAHGGFHLVGFDGDAAAEDACPVVRYQQVVFEADAAEVAVGVDLVVADEVGEELL